MEKRLNYDNPLIERYASREMCEQFGPQKKFSTWRKLWVALAEAEHELGLPVTQEQIDELKSHADDINYEVESICCSEMKTFFIDENDAMTTDY